MGDKSLIEWVRNQDGSQGATWNIVRGCKELSPGCDHCYARRFAERWRGIPGHAYEAGFDPRFVPESLELPLRWTKPRTIFVNSMSDLYQGAVSSDEIAAVHGVMAMCPQHIFQILTKRAMRMRKWHCQLDVLASMEAPGFESLPWWRVLYCAKRAEQGGIKRAPYSGATWPLANVWQGVSVESPDYLSRIEELRWTPAAVRFLSLEPLLADLGTLDLKGINWVIVGGESGPGARTMDPKWVRSIRDQCARAGVPFFFKQWGGLHKKTTGRTLDGRTHDAMPGAPS